MTCRNVLLCGWGWRKRRVRGVFLMTSEGINKSVTQRKIDGNHAKDPAARMHAYHYPLRNILYRLPIKGHHRGGSGLLVIFLRTCDESRSGSICLQLPMHPKKVQPDVPYAAHVSLSRHVSRPTTCWVSHSEDDARIVRWRLRQ